MAVFGCARVSTNSEPISIAEPMLIFCYVGFMSIGAVIVKCYLSFSLDFWKKMELSSQEI